MDSPIFIVLFSILLFTLGSAGYYWREYDYKKIPTDAVVAGVDKNGNNIYIGQVSVLDEMHNVYHNISYKGVVPGRIVRCNPSIYIQLGIVTSYDKHIKILAGPPGQFEWYPTSSADIGDIIEGTTPVLGGYHKILEDGTVFESGIARTTYQGETVVGAVTFPTGLFYFADLNHQSQHVDNFEILLFKDLEEQCVA